MSRLRSSSNWGLTVTERVAGIWAEATTATAIANKEIYEE